MTLSEMLSRMVLVTAGYVFLLVVDAKFACLLFGTHLVLAGSKVFGLTNRE